MKWLRFVLLPVLLNGLELTYDPEELEEFRVDQKRIITLFLSISEEELKEDVNLTPEVSCADKSVCNVSDVVEVADETGKATKDYNITLEGLFIGITHLNVKVNNMSLGLPYIVRVKRAEFYVFLANAFATSAALFVIGVTFMMGTQLEWSRIKSVMKKPVGPMIGFICQFLLMPLTGYLLAKYGLPDDQVVLRLALFAASTCPGGGKSSFWTIIFGGNLDLSVAMTFTQTIAALVMMPLWLSTLGKEFTTKRVDVPFLSIAEGLLALLIPSALGMYFIHKKPHLLKKMERYIKVASWVATLFFTLFGIFANWYVLLLLNFRVFALGCLLPWSGYIIAYITASIFKQDFKDKITIAIETGVQNMAIATIIMIWSLPEPEVDMSLTILLAAMLCTDKPLIILWFVMKCWKKWRNRDGTPEEKYKVSSNGVEITVTKMEDEIPRKDSIVPVGEKDPSDMNI